jgi:hypothetical protein
MRLALILSVLLLSGCSIRKFYPLAGSVVGGSAGSLGGPVTAGLGAGAGWTVGEMAKDDKTLEEAKEQVVEQAETIRALSEGDVKALLEQESKKNQGFIANLEQGIYSVLKIAGCVILMLVLTPIIYTRLKCKKTLEILGLKKDENVERL